MGTFFRRHKLLCVLLPVVILLTAAIFLGVWQYSRAKEVRSYVEEGNRYLADLNYEQASICYTRALDIDKYNKDANLGMAECYEVGGQNVYAENIYRTLLERNPKADDVYPLFADLLIRTGKHEEAKQIMADATKHLNPNQYEVIAEWYALTHPTAPTYDYDSGSYDDRIMVSITADPADLIYYTTDGTDPTAESRLYSPDYPIVMYNGTNTIRACAYNASGFSSTISEGIFTINITETVVTVADPVMEDIIRTTLSLPRDEDIHNDDIAQITSLYLIGNAYRANTAPTSLTYHEGGDSVTIGYDNYTSEYQRQYSEGELVSLSSLAYMPFLKTLEIAWQPHLDITTIAGAASLKELSVIGCGLTNDALDSIAALHGLTTLALGWNHLDDIAPLSALTGLETLSLWGNRVADVTPLSALTALTHLDIAQNDVADVSALSSLSALRELWMYGNRVSSVAPLAKLDALQVLMVRGNPITDGEEIRPIYPHLTRLDVDLLGLARGLNNQ